MVIIDALFLSWHDEPNDDLGKYPIESTFSHEHFFLYIFYFYLISEV
jgi:hypothetical protein